MILISGRELMNELVRAGVIPPNCRRVVIDCHVEDVSSVHYEVIGDKRLLSVDWEAGVKVTGDAGS